jgi:endonuclease-3 related protein
MEKGRLEVREALGQVYERLLGQHGSQSWWPADSPFEVTLGAILTQNTAWANVEKALANLKTAGTLDPTRLRALPLEELARLIRPAGSFNGKARKLQAFLAYLARYGDDLPSLFSRPPDRLRQELLEVHGVGEETADSILLYAGRLPSFVIDAYTRRILGRLGLAEGDERYGELQALFQEALPQDEALYNEYHALLVRHGKEVCIKRQPRCTACALLSLCPTGQGAQAGAPCPPIQGPPASPEPRMVTSPGVPRAKAKARRTVKTMSAT